MYHALCTLSFSSVGLYVFPEERFGARPAYDTFIYIMYSLVYNLGVFFHFRMLVKIHSSISYVFLLDCKIKTIRRKPENENNPLVLWKRTSGPVTLPNLCVAFLIRKREGLCPLYFFKVCLENLENQISWEPGNTCNAMFCTIKKKILHFEILFSKAKSLFLVSLMYKHRFFQLWRMNFL